MSRMCENGETKRTAHVISEKLRTCDVSLDKNVNFSNLLLSDAVLQGLVKSGFHTPSPIQLKAIPLGRCGLDLIVQAKSGTGKTCVFTVIALEGIVVESKSLQVLVLAPTREIAVQIHDVIQSIGQCLPGLRCHTFIGGLPVSEDRQKLKKCHIAVGSPGRIKQLIEENALSTENVRLFILDEADKLLEEGFQEQINWIYSSLPENKQMVALSATYPEYLAHHLKVYMRNPTFVRLNSVDPALLGVKQFYQVVRFHPLPHVAFENKVQHLTHLLSTVAFHQCLIFSNYQSRAESLSNILNSRGLPSTCIAGSLDQKQRMEAMSKLRNFECRVLISTDLTSRGIDVDKINLVINLDLPKDHETYLHRIGRAGRFGSYGVAVTYVCRGNEELALRTMEKACNTHIDTLPDPVPSDLAKNESYLNLNELVTTEQIDTSLTMGKTSILDRFTAGNKEGDTSKTCPSSFDSCSLGEARNEAVNGYLQSAVPPDGLIGPELGVDKSVFFENCLDSYLGSETSSQEMPSGCKNLNPATGISAAYSCTAPAEADDKLRRLSVDNIEELDRSSIRGGCENSSVDGERDLRKPGVISAEEATSCTNNQDSIFSFVGNGKERVRIPKLTFSKTKVKNIETSYDGIMQDFLTFCRSGESHSAIDKAGDGVSYGDQSADGDTQVAGMDRGQLKCYEVGLIEQVSGLLESVYIDYLTVSRFCHMTGQSSVACRPFHFLHQRESLRECDVGQPKPLFEKSTQTEAVGDLGLQTMDSCGKSANFDLSSGRHYDSGLLMTTELSNPGNDSSSEDLESDSCSDLTECSDKDSDEWSETELSGLAGTHAGYCPECDPQDCQTYENNPDDSYCLPSQSCCCHGNGCVNNDMGHGNQPYEDHGVWGIYPYSSTMYSALCQSYYTQAMSWQGWKSHKS